MSLPIFVKRFRSSLLVYTSLLFLALLVSACAVPMPATTNTVTEATVPTVVADKLFPLTIADAAGQEFTFDAPPKLGCWWAGCTEMLADLGIAPHAGSYDDKNKNSVFFYPVGVPAHNIADTENPELWAAAEVDLILMRVPNDPAHDPLKAAAPIFYLQHPSYGESAQTGYQAFIANLHILGQLTGQPAAADAAIARFDNVLANLRALSTPETKALKVAVLFNGEGYRFIAPGNPFCVALAEVGLGNCIGEGAASTENNAEEFLSLDPDWIVYQIGDGSYKDRTDPIWSQLTAVKAGHVYDAQGHRYYCCSLRGLTHALQEYAHYVLPAANIPAPGLWLDFDPSQSPLIQPSAATTTTVTNTVMMSTGSHTVTHVLGVTKVPANPQRIVAIGSSETEVLVTLGIKPVGFAAWIGAGNTAQVPAHVSAAMDLSGVEFLGDADQPNLEKLAVLAPDLIVMNGNTYYQELYDKVSQLAPTVAFEWWSAQENRALWQDYFVKTATALGQAEQAQAVLAAWQTRIATFKAAAALDTKRISVIRIMPDSIRLYFKGSYSGTILEEAGVLRVASQDGTDFADTISLEQLPLIDGDILLIAQGDPQATIYKQMLASPLWQQLKAVKTGQVYLVNHDVWIGGGGFVSANLILDDLERIFLKDGAGMTKAE